jgi:hypothetical protein
MPPDNQPMLWTDPRREVSILKVNDPWRVALSATDCHPLSSMSTSALSPFQRQWREYASRFGLDVSIPFQFAVGEDVLEVPVLLRDFGEEWHASRNQIR